MTTFGPIEVYINCETDSCGYEELVQIEDVVLDEDLPQGWSREQGKTYCPRCTDGISACTAALRKLGIRGDTE